MRPSVFLDTVGLVATWDVADQWHEAATDSYVRLLEEGADTVTTSFVIAECGNAAARKRFRNAVDRLRENLEISKQLIHPTPDDWRTARAAYRRGEAGSAGIVDHLSFVVMRRLGIARVFTNDKHFAAPGST